MKLVTPHRMSMWLSLKPREKVLQWLWDFETSKKPWKEVQHLKNTNTYRRSQKDLRKAGGWEEDNGLWGKRSHFQTRPRFARENDVTLLLWFLRCLFCYYKVKLYNNLVKSVTHGLFFSHKFLLDQEYKGMDMNRHCRKKRNHIACNFMERS